MICPKCLVQMHQFKQIGGGKSTDKGYTTWEIKQCPQCGRLVKEYYSCKKISYDQANRYLKIKKVDDHIIEPLED